MNVLFIWHVMWNVLICELYCHCCMQVRLKPRLNNKVTKFEDTRNWSWKKLTLRSLLYRFDTHISDEFNLLTWSKQVCTQSCLLSDSWFDQQVSAFSFWKCPHSDHGTRSFHASIYCCECVCEKKKRSLYIIIHVKSKKTYIISFVYLLLA